MMEGFLPVPDSEKLIGGNPHVKVHCIRCAALIFVNKSRMLQDGSFIEDCSECGFYKSKRPKASTTDKALATDIRYHG
jgi:hypothetical protein